MQTPEEIEARLQSALIPRGFSEQGSASMNDLIDELSGETGEADEEKTGKRGFWISGSAAAAIALVVGLSALWNPSQDAVVVELGDEPAEPFTLISESEGVVAVEPDDEFLADAEGNLLRAWHVQVVNEEFIHDVESGHDIRVLHPRDELVLMPVSSF